MPNCPDWLTARPIAHRGLHERSDGRIENTMPAFEAAVEGDFAIELDVQLTSDGDAVVFHDHVLDRLTGETGPVLERTARELTQVAVTGAGARIDTLATVLAQVDGRVPLVVEVKSRFDGDVRLADAVAGALAAYRGPAAIMSFDPQIVARVAKHETGRPLGIVAAGMGWPHWMELSAWKRFVFGALVHPAALGTDFVSYDQSSLPALSPLLAKFIGRKALISWTVKDQATAKRLAPYVDQITFEGFDPHV
jgi:glycerophosphoryl diester phosphodiesterase